MIHLVVSDVDLTLFPDPVIDLFASEVGMTLLSGLNEVLDHQKERMGREAYGYE